MIDFLDENIAIFIYPNSVIMTSPVVYNEHSCIVYYTTDTRFAISIIVRIGTLSEHWLYYSAQPPIEQYLVGHWMEQIAHILGSPRTTFFNLYTT